MNIVCLLNDKKWAQKVWSKTWCTKNLSVIFGNIFRVNTVYSYVENMKTFDLTIKHGALVVSNVTNLLRQNNFIKKILKYLVPYKVFSYHCFVINCI